MRESSENGPAAWLSTTRLEAFSDGVFAVAITLLVLNLQIPQLASSVVSKELLPKLLVLWPKLLSYLRRKRWTQRLAKPFTSDRSPLWKRATWTPY